MKKPPLLLASISMLAVSSCSLVRIRTSENKSSLEPLSSSKIASFSQQKGEYYLSEEYIFLNIGESKGLHMWRQGYKDSVYGSDWRSTNPSIVKVSQTGVVTGLAVGDSIIYVDAPDGETLECKVTVVNPSDTYKLEFDTVNVVESFDTALPDIYKNDEPYKGEVTWISADTNIAKINGNQICAIFPGVVPFYAMFSDQRLVLEVTVSPKAGPAFAHAGEKMTINGQDVYGWNGTDGSQTETVSYTDFTSNVFIWNFIFIPDDGSFAINTAWLCYSGDHRVACSASIAFNWYEYESGTFLAAYYPEFDENASENAGISASFNPEFMRFDSDFQSIAFDINPQDDHKYTVLQNNIESWSVGTFELAMMEHVLERAHNFAVNCLVDNIDPSLSLRLIRTF